MASNTIYDVTYQFGNKTVERDLVIASAGDENTIKTVLANNGKSHPSGAVKILQIRNASNFTGILS
jgi:hypothetical protein